jgi:Ca-activated chloride channel family protein
MKWPVALSWALCGLIIAGSPVMAEADEKVRIWTHLVSPTEGQEVIGELVIEAGVVAAEEVRDVVFFVDGRPVGMLTSEPYRLRIDLGDENRARTVEVVATDVAGHQARQRVRTAPVAIASEYRIDLQQLYVTAVDNGSRVTDLERGDFTILDEGKAVDLVTFEGGDVPFTAALLIDASASMRGPKIEAARAGARSFIKGMKELDHGMVTVFSDVIQNTTPFSDNQEVLTAGLIGATGMGGTAVNDNLYTALKLLENRQGRRLVVLLSDGIDNHSALESQNVLEYARRSQTMVYWIRLLEPGKTAEDEDDREMASAWRTVPEYHLQIQALKDLVELSGGRIIPVHTPKEIESVFTEILSELRDQYALGYYPAEQRNDGSWRRIKVKVDRRGVKVRTHEGYLDL